MKYPDIDSVKPEGVFKEIASHSASFSELRDVYLGTADESDYGIGTLESVAAASDPDGSIYATCGGFLSLNLLNALVDKKVKGITFFDINEHSIAFARSVIRLIKNSNNIKHFVEQYFMLNVGEEDGKYIFLPTTKKDRKTLFTKNKKYYNKTSSLIFEAISKSPYDKEQLYINGFMHLGGTEVGRVELYPRGDGRYMDSNSLALGDGWLTSDETFLAMKSWLKSTNIKFLATNITELPSEAQDIVFSSNIGSWTSVNCPGSCFP